ncbi:MULTISPECIES: hypothetical protein [unclassified Streptomyces]|uniref:hypothetical protein n=1 Tax=unclassified Streptomyces TaxID=2593676 RepID=UPI002DD85F78|nr:hypothetical protein [Streptomyces sp. NBC_01445]WSE09492.1 hypothetical protein OG574_42670 [Streptomyces sp. NBC_01445]
MDADDVAEDLYRLPPVQFMAARNAQVAEAKRAGDTAAARRIAAFRKPTLAAWVSNLLARETEEAGQLLELAEALREAHRTLDPEQFRTLSHQQHVLIAGLARQAGGLARRAGQPVSLSVLHEVEQILHAALADAEVAEQWATGRLTKVPTVSTDFPGTAPLAQVSKKDEKPTPAAASKAPDPAEEKRRVRLKEAMKAATEAAAEAGRRDDEVRRAEEEHERATARRSAADERVALLTVQLGDAEEERRTAAEAADEASVRVRDTAREQKAARRRAATTSRAVERLSGGDSGR